MDQIIAGERAQLRKNFGQFNAFIQNAGDPREPCILFQHAHGRKRPVFGVGLSKLHEYFDDRQMPTAYAIGVMERGARLLGFEDKGAPRKLMDALYDMVGELVKAVPAELEDEPAKQGDVVLGEATLRANGDVIRQETLLQ